MMGQGEKRDSLMPHSTRDCSVPVMESDPGAFLAARPMMHTAATHTPATAAAARWRRPAFLPSPLTAFTSKV